MKQALKADLIVVGAGPAGMMAAITAARNGFRVMLVEKLSRVGSKLKATGGGRCNLANTLGSEEFIARFGRDGRFMIPALSAFDQHSLSAFFTVIGVKTHAPDGYRVFPVAHDSLVVVSALEAELKRLGVTILATQKVEELMHDGKCVSGVRTQNGFHEGKNVIIATGGLGYPQLGAEGDGYAFARAVGHTVTPVFPAMLPLRTRESWVKNCRADTIGNAELRINIPQEKTRKAKGDLIFTIDGIRGPAVLDFAREVTPLLEKYGQVPLLINLTGGLNEEEVRVHLKTQAARKPEAAIMEHLMTLLPGPLACELCGVAGVDQSLRFNRLSGEHRERLLKVLTWTPLTVIGHDGFQAAMITRGGVTLKEVNPKTMESRLIRGLFFCGEILDLDGPCGGFNLQWAFAGGFLAGHLGEQP